MRTDYAKLEFLKQPIIQVMLDLNLLYKSKYFEILYIEHHFYNEVIEQFVREKKSSMNQYEKIRYRLYRKIHGLKFGSFYSGVPPLTSRE